MDVVEGRRGLSECRQSSREANEAKKGERERERLLGVAKFARVRGRLGVLPPGSSWPRLLIRSHLGSPQPGFCQSFDLGLGSLGENF